MKNLSCPIPTPAQLRRLRELKQTHQQENPVQPDAIAKALDPGNHYFITTSLYWECECDTNFIRSAQMNMCENCGAMKDECPDARIGDVRQHGVHVPLTAPDIMKTLEEYNTRDRTPAKL